MTLLCRIPRGQVLQHSVVMSGDLGGYERNISPNVPIEIYQNAAAKTLPAVLQYKELEFCGMGGGLGSHLFLKQ